MAAARDAADCRYAIGRRNTGSLSLASSVSLSPPRCRTRCGPCGFGFTTLLSFSVSRPLFLAASSGPRCSQRCVDGDAVVQRRRGALSVAWHWRSCVSTCAHLLYSRTNNGHGVPFGAARRLLLLRPPPLRAAWRLRVAIRAGARDSNLATLYA